MSNYPETIADALKLWDNNEPVSTVEMGGLGPSYEQAIQIGVFELSRRLANQDELPQEVDKINEHLHKELDHVIVDFKKALDGLSGAQAGAIMNLAYNYRIHGWRATLESAGKDRIILASKDWPKAEQEKEGE